VDDENSRLAIRQAEAAVLLETATLERFRILESHRRSERERADNLLKSRGITDKDLKAGQLADRDETAQVARLRPSSTRRELLWKSPANTSGTP